MSPARSKSTAAPRRRERIEIVRAAGIAAAIVFVTAVLIWLMRPGSLGTGGLMNRQPRSSSLVIGTLLVAGGVTWYVLRVSRRARGHEKVVLPIALGAVLVVAIVVGVVWPDGLLRRDVAPPPLEPTPSTVATTSTTTPATGPSTTGATGASSTTGAPTSSPPTTGTPTTTSP